MPSLHIYNSPFWDETKFNLVLVRYKSDGLRNQVVIFKITLFYKGDFINEKIIVTVRRQTLI